MSDVKTKPVEAWRREIVDAIGNYTRYRVWQQIAAGSSAGAIALDRYGPDHGRSWHEVLAAIDRVTSVKPPITRPES